MQTSKENSDTVTGPLNIPEKLKQRLYQAVLGLFSDCDFQRMNIRRPQEAALWLVVN